MNNKNVRTTIEQEGDFWNHFYGKRLVDERMGIKRKSSLWKEEYYCEVKIFLDNLFFQYKYSNLLEAGCGGGKHSILMGNNIHKTLLDISPIALEYAKNIAKKFKVEDIKFVLGNIFKIPFRGETFDFVWNTGVIEHYELSAIEIILKEMFRVTKPNGMVVIGVPNLYSTPIVKACILKYLPRFVPGYRLGTEKFYKKSTLKDLLIKVAQREGKNIEWLKIEYFGNPLPMESPKWIIKTLGRLLEILLPRNKFLIVFFCKLKNK